MLFICQNNGVNLLKRFFMKPFALLGLLLLFGIQALGAQKKAARLNAIHQAYSETQAELASYDSMNLHLDGMPEGLTLTAYYQGADLKLIRALGLNEMGELKTEYYFKNERLYFISTQHSTYNSSRYQDEARGGGEENSETFDSAKTKVEEQRYYFRKEKIFHCSDPTKEVSDTDENWEIGSILLNQGLDLQARLKERP